MSKCTYLPGSKVITRTDKDAQHPLTVLETSDVPQLESEHTVTARYDHADYVRELGCNAFRPFEGSLNG